jgi:8-oxo-dGTP pyrophosphatase MutT (NUDIX family)
MTITGKLLLTDIEQGLATHSPQLMAPLGRGHAAVAMLLRERSGFPEVLFIVRAKHDQDPWSGNIGFPGGRLNPTGESPQQAAERETLEELSLDLSVNRYLGRLDDLYGAIMPVLVSCFVYRLMRPANMKPNHEVAGSFWCPLEKLLEVERQQYRSFSYRGMERTHPVVQLLEPHEPLLWGITYRLIRNFFSLCNLDFGLPEIPPGIS